MRGLKRWLCEYGDAAVVTASSILLVLQGGIDNPPRWLAAEQTFWVAIVLLIVFGAFGPIRRMCRSARIEQLGRTTNRLKTTLVDVSAATGLGLDRLAIHVWSIERTWRHPFVGVLRRVIHFSLKDHPRTREVSFTRGEGVVGIAWRENREEARDIETEFRNVRSEADWEKMRQQDHDLVMGMTWEKFVDTRHRGAVCAAPVRSSRGVGGVVSLDSDSDYGALWVDATKDLLNRLARELQEWRALSQLSDL